MSDDNDNPHYWLGWLSASLARLAKDPDVPMPQRKQADKSLQAFLDSPCAADDLGRQLERTPR